MAETNETVLEIPAEDLDLGTPAQLEYAGFWSRVAALIVDNAIVMIFGLAILIAASSAGAGAVVIANLVFILVSILYWPLMECSERQATLGKQLLGLQVTDADGLRLNFVRALLRNLAKIISSLPFGLGFLLAAFTPRKQALHDMITKCLVVRAGPSNLMKAVVAAVVALAITIGGGYYYFAEVYLPQMADDMGRQMDKAAKQARAPVTPAPAPAPAAQPAPTATGGPKPMTPQEIAEFEKKMGEAKPESAKVAEVAQPAPAATPAPDKKPAAPASAKPAAAPAAAAKPEPKPAAAPVPAAKPEPKVAAAPAAPPKPKPVPVPADEAPTALVAEPPAPAPADEPRAPATPAVAAPAPVRVPAASGRVVSPRFNDIMSAVIFRDTATVAQLLDLGWWADRPDSNGVTPLMAAAWLGDEEATRLLLKGGADPNQSSAKGTVLDYAMRGGNSAVMELLLKATRAR